jgi:hypothetical protein
VAVQGIAFSLNLLKLAYATREMEEPMSCLGTVPVALKEIAFPLDFLGLTYATSQIEEPIVLLLRQE